MSATAGEAVDCDNVKINPGLLLGSNVLAACFDVPGEIESLGHASWHRGNRG